MIIEPQQRIEDIRSLLQAYRLDTPEQWQALRDKAKGALTLTVRLSPGRIDHLVTTPPRQVEW